MTNLTLVQAIVLVLAGHRIARIIGWDKLTQRLRQRLLGWDDNGQRNRWPANHKSVAEFVHCPWCLGFWIAVAGWIALQYWPDVVLMGAWPLAISSAIGLVSAHWDA